MKCDQMQSIKDFQLQCAYFGTSTQCTLRIDQNHLVRNIFVSFLLYMKNPNL